MGCTPSIHVSQTGVVYCRESDDSNSPRPSRPGVTAVTAVGGPSAAVNATVSTSASVLNHSHHRFSGSTSVFATSACAATASALLGGGATSGLHSSDFRSGDKPSAAPSTRLIRIADAMRITVGTQHALPRCLNVYLWLQKPAALFKLPGVLNICCTCNDARLLRVSI